MQNRRKRLQAVRHNGHTFIPQLRVVEGMGCDFICTVCSTKAHAIAFRMGNGAMNWKNWSKNEHCGVFLAKQVMES